jgi:hypothetical protein
MEAAKAPVEAATAKAPVEAATAETAPSRGGLARHQRRAQHGRSQQNTRAFHRTLLTCFPRNPNSKDTPPYRVRGPAYNQRCNTGRIKIVS